MSEERPEAALQQLLLEIMQIERRSASDPSRGKKDRQDEIRRLIDAAADQLGGD